MQQQFAAMQVDADVSAEGASPAAGDSQAELYRQKAAEAEVRMYDTMFIVWASNACNVEGSRKRGRDRGFCMWGWTEPV